MNQRHLCRSVFARSSSDRSEAKRRGGGFTGQRQRVVVGELDPEITHQRGLRQARQLGVEATPQIHACDDAHAEEVRHAAPVVCRIELRPVMLLLTAYVPKEVR